MSKDGEIAGDQDQSLDLSRGGQQAVDGGERVTEDPPPQRLWSQARKEIGQGGTLLL